MQFCDDCGSMMHADGDVWQCTSCGHEQPRDVASETTMTTTEGQTDDGLTVSSGQGTPATTEQSCPRADCDGEQARSRMLPKPGGSYEVRVFTCVECEHTWRGG